MSDSYDALVVGAGPAGLSAAIEMAGLGARVLVVDEHSRPGGQLFKQIHQFFGSHSHKAGIRGFAIGEELLSEATRLGVEVWLNSVVWGIFDKTAAILRNNSSQLSVKAAKIILATGATENSLTFPGSTLPGVMGAGALQTLINIHRVSPGKRVVMLGSGNVGLIVSYQLLQAGLEVAAIVEARPQIGGYGVHAAKLRRAGVPIIVGATIQQALGQDHVHSVELVRLDQDQRPLAGSEWILNADTVGMAAGLTPLAELAWTCGCAFVFSPVLGGHLPLHDSNMETSVDGLYVAGDIAGVEEASTAMEEGRLAGIAAAEALGFSDQKTAAAQKEAVRARMETLRSGPFGAARRLAKTEIFKQREGSAG
ncbi:FAD-dependent pyridine nucleotide-disulfide oxidoreductase [Syntrophobotulus glycolicus DSM 8271]|uniref:FAD-dependent pyridine nucleotide-disulfide oxidoreductase n=1 Tax=Syntrophobotulus glycolicus (strain DSM 8271 / FlGlyR) TaxID=645991 RepID=F0SU53_SYNGF|nr:NAD(P)/FAD-dependent oxidoreductase [Syntrophobotulus glycolicus]ADY55436.1 FAD-dependent pyridine nucleotide-disulfide oxidoreductase [Syntrophobotulus glycolicus DSM 8271]